MAQTEITLHRAVALLKNSGYPRPHYHLLQANVEKEAVLSEGTMISFDKSKRVWILKNAGKTRAELDKLTIKVKMDKWCRQAA